MKKIFPLLMALMGFMAVVEAQQIPSKFYQFDIAGASATTVTGINNYGEIVGYCTIGGVTKAFYFNGLDTLIVQYQNNPSANTYFGAINNHHLIAGYYNTTGSSSNNNPFIYNKSNGNFSDPYTPASSAYQNIAVNGLNDQGCISGQCKDGTIQNYFYNCAGGIFNVQEYANNVGGFTEYPTYGTGVNNNGVLTAFYINGANYYGLVYNGNSNTYATLTYPGASHTKAFGINNARTVVGNYNETSGFIAKPSATLGYLQPTYSRLLPTGVSNVAQFFPLAINDSNQVAGYFVDSQSVTHGIFMGLIPGHLIQLNSVIDNPGFSAPYLLNISNQEIGVVPTFKICADGSNATVLKFICDTCGAETLQDIRFIVESDQLGADTAIAGGFVTSTYQISGDTVTARFRHPQYITSSTPNQLDSIVVWNFITHEVLYKNPIALYRAPVVFVHGLTANQGTFQAMSNAFIATNLYPTGNVFSGSPLLYRIDYSPTNKAHFSTNQSVVPNGIDAVYRQARAAGYSCGSVIAAGHSMGGVLSRLYLGSTYAGVPYRKDIQKLITVSTPHAGTQLPNYGMLFATNSFTEINVLRDLVTYLAGGVPGIIAGLVVQHTVTDQLHQFLVTNGAFEDLSYTSYPTVNQLNILQSRQTKVPSVSFGTDQVGDNGGIARAVRVILSHAIYVRNIYCSDYNDLIVPFASQLEGVNIQPMVPGQIHVGATDNSTIIGRVEALLDADPASPTYFTMNGFPQTELPTPYLGLTPKPVNHLDGAGEPDSIKILSPASQTVFNPGAVVTLQIYSSGDVPIMDMLAVGNTIQPITIDTTNVSALSFTIPANALGPIFITVLGGDSSIFTASDTLTIQVGSSVAPDSIVCNPETASVALGLTQSISVTGYFSGNAISLNGLPNLEVQYDTSYLKNLGNNTFQTIQTGIGYTTLYYSYMGEEDSVVIYIYDDSTQLSTSFDYSSAQICTGGSVTFTPYSQGLVASQFWSFPGGTPDTSSQTNPTVTYSNTGAYPVSLVTTFVNGTDSSVINNLIIVTVPPAPPVITAQGPMLTTPGGYTSYQWYFGADSLSLSPIPNAVNDTLIITGNGYYMVMVNDSSGCGNNSLTAYYNTSTGVNQLSNNVSIGVYPNPTTGLVNISAISQVDSKYTISIYDILGQLVYIREMDIKLGANATTISIGSLSSGAYLLNITGNDVQWNTTIVKN